MQIAVGRFSDVSDHREFPLTDDSAGQDQAHIRAEGKGGCDLIGDGQTGGDDGEVALSLQSPGNLEGSRADIQSDTTVLEQKDETEFGLCRFRSRQLYET